MLRCILDLLLEGSAASLHFTDLWLLKILIIFIANLLHQLLRLLPNIKAARLRPLMAIQLHHLEDAVGAVDAFHAPVEALPAAPGEVRVAWVQEVSPLTLDSVQYFLLFGVQAKQLVVPPMLRWSFHHAGVELCRVVQVAIKQRLVPPYVVDVGWVLRLLVVEHANGSIAMYLTVLDHILK